MDTSFGGNAIYDLSLEQGYLSSAMYGSGPLCAGFGEYEANDLLLAPELNPEPSVCNTIDELSMETFGCAQYGEFINPDDFLNDVLKSEPESCDTSPSSRDTPSPSGSQQSCESLPSSGGFDGCHVVPMHLDSPPISPEASISPTDNRSSGSLPSPPVTTGSNSESKTSTALGSLRRVKANPKSSISNKTITKKTIVLSAKDYKALLANMKQQPSNNTILLKATPTNKLPIMPTANGFKATSFATCKQDNPPVLPKPQTTTPLLNGTHKSKESPTIIGDISSSSASPLTVPMILASGVNISEQTIDEKLLKKHQRMIKNRQSAIMSRVKKKEYVTSLEDRIQALTSENEQLRVENANLLERLKVGCSCVAGSLLIGSPSAKHVTPTARKNVAIVLAMLFMVSLNFYPIGNLLMNNERVGFDDDTSHGELVHHSRGLLWTNETTIPAGSERTSYHLNITALDELTKKDSAPLFPSIECPFYVNQTENIRLASELRRWIGENGYKNLTDGKGEADLSIDTFDKMFRLKDAIDSMYRQMKDISVQMKSFERRQKKVAVLSEKQKLRKLKHAASGQREVTPYHGRLHKQHDLDLYYPSVNMKYAEFFEEIGRRDDTFYLVSFSEEHLLLPALAYNKTNRPRMSLMLPTVAAPGGTMGNGTNRTDKITLMQIDCEVMNTSVIQIREKMIPGDLRPHGGGETSKARANAFGGDRNTTTTNTPTGPSNQTNDNANHRTDGKGRMVRDLRSNLSSSTPARINRKEPAVHHQHAPSRPFFVERMNEHLKSEHHVN